MLFKSRSSLPCETFETPRSPLEARRDAKLQAANQLMDAMGGDLHGRELLAHLIEARLAWTCPEPGDPRDLAHRLGRTAHCLVRGPEADRRAELFGTAA